MAMAEGESFCSRCAKPWQNTHYKACEDCRRKDAECARAARQKRRRVASPDQVEAERPAPAQLLIDDYYNARCSATTGFPPNCKITPQDIREAMQNLIDEGCRVWL